VKVLEHKEEEIESLKQTPINENGKEKKEKEITQLKENDKKTR